MTATNSFRLLLVAVCSALLMGVSAGSGNSTDTAFDMYVFAYSWQPEFCYNQPTYTGCATPLDYWKSYFTLHGLWPQYSAGGYPADCTTEAFDSAVTDKIGMDTMLTYWPNVQATVGSADYDSFWEHEWSKHGTCTGLSQTDYFNDAINLLKSTGTPKSVTANVGGSISAASLRTDFGGATYVALQCNAGQYLVGAYTCWTQVNGAPGKVRECPADVQAEDTCTSETVYIQAF